MSYTNNPTSILAGTGIIVVFDGARWNIVN